MRIENQALKRLLSNNPLAEAYAKESFLNMGEALDEKVADYLYNQILAYSKIGSIKEKIFSGHDIGDKLELAMELMPGLAFSVPARFKSEGLPGLSLQQLQIAVLDSALNRYRESKKFVNAFLASIPFSAKISGLSEQMKQEGGDESFMPRQVMFECGQVAQHLLALQVGNKRTQQIEVYYIFQTYSQIYLHFYLELLLLAPNPVVVEVIRAVFSFILAALRRFEVNHFHQAEKPDQEQIERWIDRDSAQVRHPRLRKHIFNYVSNYCPIVQIGSVHSLSATGQKILHSQLEAFKKAGSERLCLILLEMKKYRGSRSVRFILGQMQRNYLEVIQNLDQHLEKVSDPPAVALRPLVSSALPKDKPLAVAAKKLTYSSTPESYESKRLLKAKKNLAEYDHGEAMNYHKVAEYLRDRLQKLYERVKIEGAMTKDKIPGYLAQFTDHSSSILVKKKLSTREVAQFADSTGGIIENIGVGGGLSPEEIVEKKQKVEQLSAQLGEVETEEAKVEILNAIGGELMDSQNQADARLPEEERKSVEFEKLKNSQIISIGVERKCPMVTVGEFFLFPLGVKKEGQEEAWFSHHIRYLDLLESDKLLTPEKRQLIKEVMGEFEKIVYRKVFDIFPNDKFDDSILSAVYSVWENNGLNRLRHNKSA